MTEVVLHRLELEDDVRERLLEVARSHGRTVEEEVRAIVQVAVMGESPPKAPGLGSRIAARFAGIGLNDDEAIQVSR